MLSKKNAHSAGRDLFGPTSRCPGLTGYEPFLRRHATQKQAGRWTAAAPGTGHLSLTFKGINGARGVGEDIGLHVLFFFFQ